jgi:hypothetical protein
LELNGKPRRTAIRRRLLVASSGGEVFAALEYRVEPPRLLPGGLVSDPLAGERFAGRVLYAEAHALACETDLEEVRASPLTYEDRPHDVGYRRRHGRWTPDADASLQLREELPGGGRRKALALWGSRLTCPSGPSAILTGTWPIERR